MQFGRVLAILALLAPGLMGCATPQAMTVGGIKNASPKYRNAVAVRNVSGGQAMNVLTMPGVADEPLKTALESSLSAIGYLAQSGTPKYFVDAEIHNLDQPLIGFDLSVTADVTYKVAGAAGATDYPVRSSGKATFADSPIAADRLRIANERAMRENIRLFLEQLR